MRACYNPIVPLTPCSDMFVDSHCHLHLIDLEKDNLSVDDYLERAKQAKVEHFLNVCTELGERPTLEAIAEKGEHISFSLGVHPNHAAGESFSISQIIDGMEHPQCVAVGETGLDYYWQEGDLTWQRERFATHIQAAHQVKKPLIIHTRQAKEDTISIMRAEQAEKVRGVMHCFTEDWEMAKQALDLDFYISFSGIVTFKKALELQEVAKKVPLDRMLIETDSPYLAPVPFRGKQNEPSFVPHVAKFIAELRGQTCESIAEHTTKNYYQLFHRST